MIAIYARVSTEEQVTQNKPPFIFFPQDRHSVYYPCTTAAKRSMKSTTIEAKGTTPSNIVIKELQKQLVEDGMVSV
ncbi:hypothetical protein [Fictibacillus terranigra]|uniref:Resolvase/invertase-type recombinase catalytic domain-containing protein n=1 Tax=Fictibacillus terranigra TaxID=3058424 RepID=A0ABT8EBU1_9BACL|nr:hypothetical protein [Fictibacillus sp. CENA-BCM004]MDN4075342.1 hypothetical protein [Fictibacillus sp. CENA-BCM004]